MLSITQLNNMSTDQLIHVLNTQAEKYNKQITRSKKAGTYARAKELNPHLKRLPIISKSKAAKLKENHAQGVVENALIKTYVEREKMEAGGATKRNIARMEKKVKRVSKALGIPEEAAAAVMPRVDDLALDAKARRELYYEVLKAGVEMGVYNSFADIDKPTIPKEHFEWYMRREVNKVRREGESYGIKGVIPSYNELYARISTDLSETKSIVQGLL